MYRIRCRSCGKFFSSERKGRVYCSRLCDYKDRSRILSKSPRFIFRARKESLRSRDHMWTNAIKLARIHRASRHKERGELLDHMLSLIVEGDVARDEMKKLRKSASRSQTRRARRLMARVVSRVSTSRARMEERARRRD